VGPRDGKTRFLQAKLVARTGVEAGSDLERARALHTDAHDQCFMANSVNFPIEVEVVIV
jgi:organic hydroperoxide reductase OsmC/OhrA